MEEDNHPQGGGMDWASASILLSIVFCFVGGLGLFIYSERQHQLKLDSPESIKARAEYQKVLNEQINLRAKCVLDTRAEMIRQTPAPTNGNESDVRSWQMLITSAVERACKIGLL